MFYLTTIRTEDLFVCIQIYKHVEIKIKTSLFVEDVFMILNFAPLGAWRIRLTVALTVYWIERGESFRLLMKSSPTTLGEYIYIIYSSTKFKRMIYTHENTR